MFILITGDDGACSLVMTAAFAMKQAFHKQTFAMKQAFHKQTFAMKASKRATK